MKRSITYIIVLNAIIAAVYATATLFFPILSFGALGAWQFRFSEALTILPSLIPTTWIGVTIGCGIANIASPFGLIDVLIGTAATFVASIMTSRIRNPFVAAIPPVLVNAILLPIVWWISAGDIAYWFNFAVVLVCQGAVLYLLGVPLFYLMRNKVMPRLNIPDGLLPSV